MRLTRSLFAMIAAVTMLSLAVVGCKTTDPGVRNYAGTVSGVVTAEPERVTAAARQTVEDLKFNSIFSEVSVVDGVVTARTARDNKVDIDIKKEGEGVSRVHIRIGEWGDESLSMQILDSIRQKVQ